MTHPLSSDDRSPGTGHQVGGSEEVAAMDDPWFKESVSGYKESVVEKPRGLL